MNSTLSRQSVVGEIWVLAAPLSAQRFEAKL
jgi:hypothetical protein